MKGSTGYLTKKSNGPGVERGIQQKEEGKQRGERGGLKLGSDMVFS